MNHEYLPTVLDTKNPTIRRYEYDEIKYFIEAAAKINKARELSLGLLTSNTDEKNDVAALNRIQGIIELTPKEKKPKKRNTLIYLFLI